MCGILAVIYTGKGRYPMSKIQKGVDKIIARGPEGTCVKEISVPSVSSVSSVPSVCAGGALFAFTRLAINGLTDAGMQPFSSGQGGQEGQGGQGQGDTWMCNGEIYNAVSIEKQIGYVSKSSSDCEVLGPLWSTLKDPVAFCRALDGVFSLVLYDSAADMYVVARDPYGVRPLFYAEDRFYGILFGSERKALEAVVDEIKVYEFPPGEVWTVSGAGACVKEVYHTVPWLKTQGLTGDELRAGVRASLVSAVEKRLMTERPIAALLSGGLDSSLIAALVQSMLKARRQPPLKTFSIGMAGSSDLEHAREVADWIGSDHHEVVVTADEMFAAIPDVIRDVESYDITTVRASVGNWLIAREVRRQSSCKVVFNGDGSDEVWGSYLYFFKAPNDYAFEADSVRLLKEMHRYDVLRSDRSISSHGLEARTPFLDKQFVATAMAVPTVLRRPVGGDKGRIEKNLLREAFDEGLLPGSVLWRKKEAFSDGVSSTEKSWFQEIQERVLEGGLVPADWEKQALSFAEPRPKTPEAFYYRSLYEKFYTKTGDYWPFWMPRWSPETTDPSARTLAL